MPTEVCYIFETKVHSGNFVVSTLLVMSMHWQLIRIMVFNATFNNISGMSWRSVLLVEETGENHRPVASHWQTLLHNVVSSTPRHEQRFELTTSVMIDTDYTGSWKSNYHTITTIAAPIDNWLLFKSEVVDLYK